MSLSGEASINTMMIKKIERIEERLTKNEIQTTILLNEIKNLIVKEFDNIKVIQKELNSKLVRMHFEIDDLKLSVLDPNKVCTFKFKKDPLP